MALKPSRVEPLWDTDMNYVMNEVAEAGGIVVASTVGSGSPLGDPANVATYAANPSGKVALGLLMCDVVNIDETLYHRNFLQDQVPSGYNVCVAKRGRYLTNMTAAAITTAPATAYLGASGKFSATAVSGSQAVGKFLTNTSTAGSTSGYCWVDVNC